MAIGAAHCNTAFDSHVGRFDARPSARPAITKRSISHGQLWAWVTKAVGWIDFHGCAVNCSDYHENTVSDTALSSRDSSLPLPKRWRLSDRIAS